MYCRWVGKPNSVPRDDARPRLESHTRGIKEAMLAELQCSALVSSTSSNSDGTLCFLIPMMGNLGSRSGAQARPPGLTGKGG